MSKTFLVAAAAGIAVSWASGTSGYFDAALSTTPVSAAACFLFAGLGSMALLGRKRADV